MTLGQRIQAARKQAGLSQEALGERLGVSRQAISKWEGDVTIPEIDKLIAMSRLFGLPVGVLLGEEDLQAPAARELTDRELAAAEAIAAKYVEQLASRPPRKKWPYVLATLILALVCFNIFSRMGSLDNRFRLLQSDLWQTTNSLSYEISGITTQVEDLLDRQNRVTAAAAYTRVQTDYPAGQATYALSATPRTYVEGMTAQFTALSGGETVTAEGVLGSDLAFTAQLTCPLSDEIILSAAFRLGEETQTQILGEETGLLALSYPTTMAHATLYGDALSQDGSYHWTTPIFINAHPTILNASGGQSLTVSPTGYSLQVYVNQDKVWSRDEVDMSQVMIGDIPGGTLLEGVPMDLTLTLAAGDQLTLTATVTDNLGRSWREVLDCWVVDQDRTLGPGNWPAIDALP